MFIFKIIFLISLNFLGYAKSYYVFTVYPSYFFTLKHKDGQILDFGSNPNAIF